MTEECFDLKEEAGKAADAYFPVMTQWATTGANDERLRMEARKRAGVFRGSLKWLIDCYGRLGDKIRVRRKLEDAVQLEQLVENDIAILDRHGPNTDN